MKFLAYWLLYSFVIHLIDVVLSREIAKVVPKCFVLIVLGLFAVMAAWPAYLLVALIFYNKPKEKL
jgi:hypothetical protein